MGMPDSQEDPLLTLYSEKMKYLGECHKVYYWMLALFATGLVVTVGFLVKSDKSENAIPNLVFGAPLLINAWCAGYLFCYWHNNFLSQNIDYIEDLIGKRIDIYNGSFRTWYKGFFVEFTEARPFALILYVVLGLTVFLIIICCLIITVCEIDTLGVNGLLAEKNCFYKLAYGIFAIGPTITIAYFHWKFKESLKTNKNENDKYKDQVVTVDMKK